ncbi:oxygenase MpaB family protein [Thermoactinospora rubra]|uniref:oxygenase MpaB family protein n=1 Tax=Thermoactinospora rubra TaxID=1088767 RepID=UPI000A1114DB|nr:oxygenase MpaB family protein [Thermoactinospora rubra]
METFGPGSMQWDVAGEYRNLLVAGSALVLQTMHPAVGAAVAEHSDYKRDPWGRLDRTLASIQKWVYSDGPREGERLRELHRPISGVDERGRGYHALNGEAWAWVHLTLFERFLTLRRIFAEPYSAQEERRLYEEFKKLGRILQVPGRQVPDSIEAFRAYFDRMVAERLEPHPTAFDVLATMRDTPVPPALPRPLRLLWRPVGMGAGEFNYFVTVGTLPPAVRDKLGLRWTARQERLLRAVGRTVAAVTPRLPERLRYLPLAYRARQAAQARASAA